MGETKVWKWFQDSKLLSRAQKRRLQKLHQGGSLALYTDWNGYGGLRTSHWIHNQIVKHQQIWDIQWCTFDAKHTRRYWNFALYVLLLCIYKITNIERAHWLAERRVCTRVCKHGCDVKMFCFSRANHASTNLKKFLVETRQGYFIYPFPCLVKLGKSLQTPVSIFFRLSWQFKWIRILELITLARLRNW